MIRLPGQAYKLMIFIHLRPMHPMRPMGPMRPMRPMRPMPIPTAKRPTLRVSDHNLLLRHGRFHRLLREKRRSRRRCYQTPGPASVMGAG